MKPLNIGLIGYGFMGRTHSNGYKRVNDFFPELQHRPVLKAVCGRSEDKVNAFADQWQYETTETDWRALISRPDIDAIDICTPNNSHAEIAIAAAEAGKMILCEKPLALNPAEGQKMVDAVEKAGVANTVWYNYRRVPAVSLAKQLIDEGQIDFLDISLWDSFKRPHEERYQDKSLLAHFADLDFKQVLWTVAGKIRTGKDVREILDAGIDFVTIGRSAILHHDFPVKVMEAPGFTPTDTPVSKAYLRKEGLGEKFIGYMEGWKGFVG